MINKYVDYLEMSRSMSVDQMEKVHQMIVTEVSDDVEAMELYDELISVATKYAATRAQWLQMSREEKIDQDSLRTSNHDSVIIHFNMLARYLRMQGKAAE